MTLLWLRLHEKGLICDPVNKSKSLVLTDEGLRRSEELFRQLFTRQTPASLSPPADRHSGFPARFSRPFCSQIVDSFIQLGEVGIGGIMIAAAPPFEDLGMSIMRRVCKRLAELLLSLWTTDVLRRAVSCCFDEHRTFRADCREDALDFDAVFPAVAKVIKIFERFCTGVLNGR